MTKTKKLILITSLSLVLCLIIGMAAVYMKSINDTNKKLTVPPIQTEQVDLLPESEKEAFLTAAPMGGNPVYYFFEKGLTYYRYDQYNKTYHKDTLELPEGYDNGEIIYAQSGAGSGEITINVKTSQGYLSYTIFHLSSEDIVPEVYRQSKKEIEWIERQTENGYEESGESIPDPAESKEYTDAIRKYNDYLSGDTKAVKGAFQIGVFDENRLTDGKPGIDSYAFYDVTGDGIPELHTKSMFYRIFGYKNGLIAPLFSSDGALGENSTVTALENKALYAKSLGNDGVHYYTYTTFCQNGVARMIWFDDLTTYDEEANRYSNRKAYILDGNNKYIELTAKEFESFLDECREMQKHPAKLEWHEFENADSYSGSNPTVYFSLSDFLNEEQLIAYERARLIYPLFNGSSEALSKLDIDWEPAIYDTSSNIFNYDQNYVPSSMYLSVGKYNFTEFKGLCLAVFTERFFDELNGIDREYQTYREYYGQLYHINANRGGAHGYRGCDRYELISATDTEVRFNLIVQIRDTYRLPNYGFESCFFPVTFVLEDDVWKLDAFAMGNYTEYFGSYHTYENFMEEHTFSELLELPIYIKRQAVILGDWLAENEFSVKRYVIADIERWGDSEVALWLNRGENEYCGFLLLSMGSKYGSGHYLDYRSFNELKEDGTFSFSSGVSDHGVAKIKLYGGVGAKILPLAYCESNYDGSISYFIDNVPATKEEFDKYISEQNQKPNISWTELPE